MKAYQTTERVRWPVRITSKGFAAGGRRVHDDFMARYAGLRKRETGSEKRDA